DLDLDFHPRVGHVTFPHGGGRLHAAETAAETLPAERELVLVGQQVADPDHVRESAAGLGERGFDVVEALLGLLDDIFGNGPRGVVETSGTGYVHPTVQNHG